MIGWCPPSVYDTPDVLVSERGEGIRWIGDSRVEEEFPDAVPERESGLATLKL